MEYVFGTEGEIEVLKTKGREHSNLTGYQQVEQVHPNQTVTDNFRVVRKLDSKEDEAGDCYDWYEIDRHSRTVDKTGPLAASAAQNAANIDYIAMMSGIELPGMEDGEGGTSHE